MTISGAAAAIAPEPEHGPGPVATADDVITLADLKDRERQLASTGTCSHPVKLHGRVTAIDLATGEAAPVYDTAAEPGAGVPVGMGGEVRSAFDKLREAVTEAGGSKAASAAMSNLAEAIQGLVHHMRTEQQMIRDWVDAQAEQQREIKRLLEIMVRENAHR